MNRLRKYIEGMAYGRKTNRTAYVMKIGALPDPLPGSKWLEDTSFNAADELLRDPGLKAVFKAALESGCEIVTRADVTFKVRLNRFSGEAK
jgi:hypothetical protein